MEPLIPIHEMGKIDPFMASLTEQYMKMTGFDANALLPEINEQFEYWSAASRSAALGRLDSCKSNADAVKFRNLGNQQFKKRQRREALRTYTRSVAAAIEDSEDLALAYANRSAALIELGEFVPCLLDINRALNGKYPEHLREKLRERKKRCLVRIRQQNNGIRVEGNETNPPIKTKSDEEWRDKCSTFGNPFLPNASPKIKLKCDQKFGRYTVAVKNIQPGEILSAEEFFVSIVMPEKHYDNCSHCLSNCSALIPCPSCTQMMYCSEDCRTRAYNSYHRTECKLSLNEPKHVDKWLLKTPALKNLDEQQLYQTKNVLRMSVRALLIGTEQGSHLENLMKTMTTKDIFKQKDDPSNKPYANDYVCALRIMKNFDEPIFRMNRQISLAVRVIVELRHLHYSEPMQNRLSDHEIFAAMLLINHLATIRSNTFGVDRMTNANIFGDCEDTVGAVVCKQHNLINHSCDPNARTLIRGREHIVYAVRPIKRGEQIFISYYDLFLTASYEQRMYQFLQYGFMCECQACTNRWPTVDVLQRRKVQFVDKKLKKQKIEELTKITSSIVADGINGMRQSDVLNLLAKQITWLHTNLQSPAWPVFLMEELFAKFMMLSYSHLYEEYMTQVRKEKTVEKTVQMMLNIVLRSSE